MKAQAMITYVVAILIFALVCHAQASEEGRLDHQEDEKILETLEGSYKEQYEKLCSAKWRSSF